MPKTAEYRKGANRGVSDALRRNPVKDPEKVLEMRLDFSSIVVITKCLSVEDLNLEKIWKIPDPMRSAKHYFRLY